MQRGKPYILIIAYLAFSFVWSGCGVGSDHPVTALADSALIPDELLGTWQAVEATGHDLVPGSGLKVSVEQQADGSVGLTLIGSGDPLEIDASLAVLGDRQILSLAPSEDEESWFFLSLVHDEQSETLTVEILGHGAISQDIELGRVGGEVFYVDGPAPNAQLTASTAGLRNYFEQYGHAFNDPIVVMKRVSEQ